RRNVGTGLRSRPDHAVAGAGAIPRRDVAAGFRTDREHGGFPSVCIGEIDPSVGREGGWNRIVSAGAEAPPFFAGLDVVGNDPRPTVGHHLYGACSGVDEGRTPTPLAYAFARYTPHFLAVGKA